MISKESMGLVTSVIAFLTVVVVLVGHFLGVDVEGVSLFSFSPSVSIHDPSPSREASVIGDGVKREPLPRDRDNTPPVSAQNPVESPSFDCAVDNSHWAERIVCSSPELAAYDRKLDDLYTAAVRRTSDGERLELRQGQRAWIAERNSCESAIDGIDCLRQVYTRRIAFLSFAKAHVAADSLTVLPAADVVPPPVPISRIPPDYPLGARIQQQQGFVLLEFTVGADGSVQNPVVLEASPPSIFDDAAVEAVRQWRYQPTIVAGRAIERPNVRVEIDFKLKS